MELLYVLLAAVGLIIVWRIVMSFMEWRSRLRLKIEPVPPGPDLEITPNPELGKVRVRPRNEPVMAQSFLAEPVVVTHHDDLSDVVTSTQDDGTGAGDAMSPVATTDLSRLTDEQSEEPVLLTPASVASILVAEQQDLFANEPIAPPPDRRQTASRAQALYGAASVEPVRPVAKEAEEKKPLDIEQVIALHVVARGHAFNGEDLLRCVLSYGLRFGDMSIFHRHEQPSGQGRVLFSMAKAVEPGIFDLESMTGEEIPGVSFFLGLPGVNSITAYDIMVDTARRLATELQGDVLDEHQQPLTRQLVEHYRERVQEFERRRLMSRPGQR